MSKRGNRQTVSGRWVFIILSIFLTSTLFCLLRFKSTHAATTASLGMVGEVKIEPDFLNNSKLEYSKTVDINVNTNSPFGYKLLFSSDSEDNSLTSSDPKNNYYIRSVEGSNYRLSNDMHNQYGYNLEAVDNKIYHYIPALSNPIQIKQVKTELTAADHVKFNLGFELESSAQPGEYHRNLIFTLLSEDQASVELVSGVEINKAIKKAVGITDASYLENPLTTTPNDPWPNLNITIARDKCSPDITKEHTSVISVPDSDTEVYLGGYRNNWDDICIWSNATELIFPEDLSYMYAGLGGVSSDANFNFANGRNKSTLNFKKVKNLDHLFHNTIGYNDGSFKVPNLFEYLKDSPIESTESLFENSTIYDVTNSANVFNRTKNLAKAFRNTKSLGQFIAPDWIIGEAENTQSMFEGSSATQITLNNATFAKTKNTTNMFKNMQYCWYIDLPNAIFSETTNTHAMFLNASKTARITLTKATFAKSTDASSMFEKAPLGSGFDLSNATFANATNFNNFFKESGQYALTVKLPKLSLASAENLSQMFYKSEIGGLALNADPMGGSHIKDMSSMFQDCPNLTEIDLHNISTGPLENIASMFKDLPNVQKIVLPNVFNTASVTDFSSFLADNIRLTTLENGDKIKLTSATDTNHMFANTISLDLKDFINHIESENITDASYMFHRTTSSQNITIPTTFKTHHISNMKAMFGGFKVPLLDISNMAFDSVTTMEEMLSGAYPNEQLTLDDYKYSAKQIIWPDHTIEAPYLASLRGLYKDNHYLSQAVFPKINTHALTDLGYMFSGLDSYITSIDLTGLDTSKVDNIESMFDRDGFDFAPVKNAFDTSNVKNMQSMFYHTRTQDGTIDLTGLNVGNVVTMNNTFADGWLEVIDLTSWDTRNVEDMSHMFDYSNHLNTVYASDSFATTKVTKFEGIFDRCTVTGALGNRPSSDGIEYARIDEPGKPGAFTRKA